MSVFTPEAYFVSRAFHLAGIRMLRAKLRAGEGLITSEQRQFRDHRRALRDLRTLAAFGREGGMRLAGAAKGRPRPLPRR